jgi:hypothetical protein
MSQFLNDNLIVLFVLLAGFIVLTILLLAWVLLLRKKMRIFLKGA